MTPLTSTRGSRRHSVAAPARHSRTPTSRAADAGTTGSASAYERRRVLGAVASAAVGGAAFAPTFGGPNLRFALAVVLPALAVGLAYDVTSHRQWSRRLRIPTAVLLGLVAVVAGTLTSTTRSGLPTGETFGALGDGVVRSWLWTLQSTSPAPDGIEYLTFVPLAVLIAAVIGAEAAALTSGRATVLPALPGLVIASFAVLVHPVPVLFAIAVVVALVLAASLVGGPRPAVVPVAMLVVAAAAVASVGAFADPAGTGSFTLRDHITAPRPPVAAAGPLDDLARRLQKPDATAFTVRQPGGGTDRWQLSVLDRFTGTQWQSAARLRRLGPSLDPTSSPSTDGIRRSATIDVPGRAAAWLPSQDGLTSADGLPSTALVDERSGALVGRADGRYRISWSAPQVRPGDLENATLAGSDTGTAVAYDRSSVPPVVRSTIRAAVGRAAPSLSTALVLERYLRQHYRVAAGTATVPTGHDWGAIADFLAGRGASATDIYGADGVGTSEQFATSYAAMAQLIGIPVRVVVGFRLPVSSAAQTVVTNSDAAAWPEIRLRGIGWVPLDPTGGAGFGGGTDSGDALGQATQQLRDDLAGENPTLPRTEPRRSTPGPALLAPALTWLRNAGITIGILVVLALVLVLGVKAVRFRLRRRAGGSAAVAAAWRETCDRLLDHGVDIERGMTSREIATAASGRLDTEAMWAMDELTELLDEAMWSGDVAPTPAVATAWAAFEEIRDDLARAGWRARIKSLLSPRSLRPNRAPALSSV